MPREGFRRRGLSSIGTWVATLGHFLHAMIFGHEMSEDRNRALFGFGRGGVESVLGVPGSSEDLPPMATSTSSAAPNALAGSECDAADAHVGIADDAERAVGPGDARIVASARGVVGGRTVVERGAGHRRPVPRSTRARRTPSLR